MNSKKIKEVMNEKLFVKNISIKSDDKTSFTIINPIIDGYDIVKHYTQFFILFYKIFENTIKWKSEELRIPYVDKLNDSNDLELIYNCMNMIYNKYPYKNFDIINSKFDKKLSYLTYEICIYKTNKTKYIIFSYEIDEYDKYWFYQFETKQEMIDFIKDEL